MGNGHRLTRIHQPEINNGLKVQEPRQGYKLFEFRKDLFEL
ncbi:MAG: hypothetical protein RIR31_1926 [Bacteroidota bacterium]|jgi:hypothetical protein